MSWIPSFPRFRARATTSLSWLALSGALTLSACGDSSDTASSPTPTPTPTLTVAGTAATGTAIAGASVDARCASGSGSATPATDGTYSISIASGSLPCVVRVTATGGVVLHSVATGSTSSVVADITPVTELVVAQLAMVDPASFYASFNAAAVTTAAVASAQAAVVTILHDAGIDLAGLGDLISRTLTAQTSTSAGDAYDAALDTLAAALTRSNTTLQDLTTSVVASASASGSGASEVASLPATLLLQPAASNCNALRSGTYRIVSPLPGGALSDQYGLAAIDAATLAIVRPDGSAGTLAASGACRFTDTNAATGYNADIVVSGAGVLLARYSSGGAVHDFIGFPEQAHSLAELAGSWNIAAMNRAGSVDVGVTGATTLDAAGQWSAVTNCENDSTWAVDTCVAVPTSVTGLLGPWTIDSAGGFDVPDAGTQVVNTRVFAYRAGGGSIMLVSVSGTGFAVWSAVHPVSLPAAGSSTTSWNLDINPDLTSNSATYETTSLVDTVDANAKSWTRTHGTVGSAITRIETVFADTPRAGYVFRPASTVTATDGSTQVTIREFTMLRVTGMGLSAGVLPLLRTFELSASEP